MNVQVIAELMTARAIDCLLVGIPIALGAWVVLRFVQFRNSAVRFFICFAALLAITSVLFFGAQQAFSVGTSRMPEITISQSAALYFFFGWAAFSFTALFRLVLGLWSLRWLRASCVPIDLKAQGLEEFGGLDQAPGRPPVPLLASNQVRVPTAIGFLRPAILLPVWTLHELSREELRAIVLHEAAHIRRSDHWTNLIQKMIRAVVFFHPAVWWIDNRLSLEREICCDDAVLAQSGNPKGYAECLVSLAEKSFLHRPLTLAQAAVSRVKHTALRIAKILDGKERKSTATWKPALIAFTAFSALSFLALEHTPQFVAFKNGEPTVASVAAEPEFPLRGTMIVPATLRESRPVQAVNAEERTAMRDLPKVVKHKIPAETPDLLTNLYPREHGPMVVNSNVRESAAPQFMLVVFQSAQYDRDGNVVVTTFVWRVSMPAKAPMGNVVNPRST
jgi:Zn-dependent protease with chaperone function